MFDKNNRLAYFGRKGDSSNKMIGGSKGDNGLLKPEVTKPLFTPAVKISHYLEKR